MESDLENEEATKFVWPNKGVENEIAAVNHDSVSVKAHTDESGQSSLMINRAHAENQYEDEDDDDEDDPFAEIISSSFSTVKKKKNVKRKIDIRMLSRQQVCHEKQPVRTTSTHKSFHNSLLESLDSTRFLHDDFSCLESSDEDELIEQALSFFQETHEEQDHILMQLHRDREIQRLQSKLQLIDEQMRISRKEVDDFIREQLDEKHQSTQLSLDKYKLRIDADQKRDLQRLQHLYDQKVVSNNAKIQKGMQMLRERHEKEVQTLQQRMHQQGKGAGISTSQAQLIDKYQRQVAEFHAKSEEVKTKTESDCKVQMDKIHSSHNTRLLEIQANRKKILDKLKISFQQVRQRHFKRLMQLVIKRKEAILKAIEQLSEPRSSMTTLNHSCTSGSAATTIPSVVASTSMESSSFSRIPSTASNIVSSTIGDSTKDPSTPSGVDEKAELCQPSPIKSVEPWALNQLTENRHDGAIDSEAFQHQRAGASSRHKHRKAIMSQVTKQLSVEIHNEGLWVSIQQSGESSETNKKLSTNSNTSNEASSCGIIATDEEEFVIWGSRARAILESIVCGEIPAGYDRLLSNWSESHPNSILSASLTNQGGQIRCIVTDLRTSDETASLQRAQAVRDFDATLIVDLETKCKNALNAVNEAEHAISKLNDKSKEGAIAIESAIKDVEKAKRMHDEFLTKFRNFLGPDGNVNEATNPSDKRELQKALFSYKSNLENAIRRENAARQAVGEIQNRIQKFQLISKNSQEGLSSFSGLLKKRDFIVSTLTGEKDPPNGKSFESADLDRASMRVQDCIACIKKTAEKRRENMNDKRTGNTNNTWIQSFPDLPTSLKKSLWHKMHRRKQQIVLRPSTESIMNQLRSKVISNSKTQDSMHSSFLQDELNNAEKLFLLASHPFSGNHVSSVPFTKLSDKWAEPGWNLQLNVYETDEPDESYILPSCPSSFLLEKNLSEIASAPGRQAASLLKPSHFRCLSTPLSTVSVASGPAENGGMIPSTAGLVEDDPMWITDEELSFGYSFSNKTIKLPIVRKKSASVRDTVITATRDTSSSNVSLLELKKPATTTAHNEATIPKKGDKTKSAISDISQKMSKNELKRRRSPKAASVEPAINRWRKNQPSLHSNIISNLQDNATKAASRSMSVTSQELTLPSSGNSSFPSSGHNSSQCVGSTTATAAGTASTAHLNQIIKSLPGQQPGSPHQSNPSFQQSSMPQFVQQDQLPQALLNPQQAPFSSCQQQRELSQLRMMQQQVSPIHHRQPIPSNLQPQPIAMQQFYNSLNNPSRPLYSQQQPPSFPGMHMQGCSTIPNPSSGQLPRQHPMQLQQQQQQHLQQQGRQYQQVRQQQQQQQQQYQQSNSSK